MNGEPSAGVVRADRGTAAVEFAIAVPVLLTMLGCLADFGLAFWYKGLLAGSVAQGGQYAFLARTDLLSAATPTAAIQKVQAVVGRRLLLPSANVTVSYPLACGCVSGTPAAFSATACGATCPNGTTAGTYVTITARHTYTPVLPFYSKLAGSTASASATVTLVESTTVRLR